MGTDVLVVGEGEHHDLAAVFVGALADEGDAICLPEGGWQPLLTFALGHEQLPASYAFAARPALTRLEPELAPEQLSAARV